MPGSDRNGWFGGYETRDHAHRQNEREQGNQEERLTRCASNGPTVPSLALSRGVSPARRSVRSGEDAFE